MLTNPLLALLDHRFPPIEPRPPNPLPVWPWLEPTAPEWSAVQRLTAGELLGRFGTLLAAMEDQRWTERGRDEYGLLISPYLARHLANLQSPLSYRSLSQEVRQHTDLLTELRWLNASRPYGPRAAPPWPTTSVVVLRDNSARWVLDLVALPVRAWGDSVG